MRTSFRIALTNTIHTEFLLPWKQTESGQQFLQNAFPLNVKLDKVVLLPFVFYVVGTLAGTPFIYKVRVTRVITRHE